MAQVILANGDPLDVPDDASQEDVQKVVDQFNQGQVAQHLGLQQPETFLGAMGRTLKEQNVDPLTNLTEEMLNRYRQGGSVEMNKFLGSLPTGAAAGLWQQSLPHTQAAIQALQQGGLPGIGSAITQGVFALPGIGPQLADLFGAAAKYSNAPAEQRSGLAGETAGQALTAGAQMFPEEALDWAGQGIREAATGLYRKTAGFPQAMSRDEAKAAAELAVREKIPLGGFLGVYGGADDAVEKLGNPKTGVIGQNMDQVKKLVQQHASEQLDMNTVLQPLMDAIDMWDKAPNGKNVADQLREMGKNFLKEKSIGIYEHKTGNLVGLKPVTMRDAQELKQGAYGILPSGMFSDAKDGWGATQKEFNKLIASGLRKGQNDIVPELRDFNDTVHNAINLKDRIEELDKKGIHFGWNDLVPLGIGAGIGALGPASGHGMMFSPEALTATAASYALSRPQTASRIAVAMGDVGRGPMSQLAAQAPRAALLAKDRQKFVDSINAKFALPPGQKLDVSQVPVSGKIPLTQIPMLVENAARAEGIDPKLARAVAGVESGMGENQGPSPKGAIGVMQLMPDAAAEMGVKDRSNAADNIRGGVKYLKKMLDRYHGDVPTALAAYNFGPANVDSGKDLPPETQAYIDNVMSKMQEK
ncbi:MAG: transglycosylase SLT domain-containing protein [Thaumarchaeota archaeon]|nr:transglycosylase SLT domain-containing protein [Nitrososphaerota archaeon]